MRSAPKPRNSYEALLQYSFRILSRKSYTRREIETKLTKRGEKYNLPAFQDAAKKVMERLTELNYLNDGAIITNHLEYRVKVRPQGRYGFLFEMRKRGIDSKAAAREWDKKAIDERALARELIAKKSVQLKELEPRKRAQRISSLLASRGFAPDVIWGIVGEWRL